MIMPCLDGFLVRLEISLDEQVCVAKMAEHCFELTCTGVLFLDSVHVHSTHLIIAGCVSWELLSARSSINGWCFHVHTLPPFPLSHNDFLLHGAVQFRFADVCPVLHEKERPRPSSVRCL